MNQKQENNKYINQKKMKINILILSYFFLTLISCTNNSKVHDRKTSEKRMIEIADSVFEAKNKSSINDITKSSNNLPKVSAYLIFDDGTISNDILKDSKYTRDSTHSEVDRVAENNFNKIKIVLSGNSNEISLSVNEMKKSILNYTFNLNGNKEFIVDTNQHESIEIKIIKFGNQIIKKNINFLVYE